MFRVVVFGMSKIRITFAISSSPAEVGVHWSMHAACRTRIHWLVEELQRERRAQRRFTISDSRLKTSHAYHDSWNRVDNFTHFWTVLCFIFYICQYMKKVLQSETTQVDSEDTKYKWSFIKKKEKNCWRN